MITGIIIPRPLLFKSFFASSQPPHQKQVSFQAATTKQNKTTDKKRHKEKNNKPNSHIDNLLFPSFS
jgi:hypothetical protein